MPNICLHKLMKAYVCASCMHSNQWSKAIMNSTHGYRKTAMAYAFFYYHSDFVFFTKQKSRLILIFFQGQHLRSKLLRRYFSDD